MTFTDGDIAKISFDTSDEWQYHEDDQTCSIMIGGMDGFALRFFDADLDKKYTDGWLDTYAVINPVKRLVEKIYFVLTTNEGGDDDGRELEIAITNLPEKKKLFDRLEKRAEECGELGFSDFIQESAEQARADAQFWKEAA